jgi:ureidoglycolate lyase
LRTLILEPLTAERFDPFGVVLQPPASAGRVYADERLGDDRPQAWPSLSLARLETVLHLPAEVRRMERHASSSQSFVPMGAIPFLVVVAPHGPDGRPDPANARAFRAADGQGITYARNVWHHPMAVLQAPATFAIMMWRDGTSGDEEFVDVEPFVVKEA